jgi:hypothetical protein
MIRKIFNDIYKDKCSKSYRATSIYTDNDIEKAIILHEGDSIPGFASFDAFLYLIAPLLDELEEPASDCLSHVYLYLEEISSFIIQKVFTRFPALASEV